MQKGFKEISNPQGQGLKGKGSGISTQSGFQQPQQGKGKKQPFMQPGSQKMQKPYQPEKRIDLFQVRQLEEEERARRLTELAAYKVIEKKRDEQQLAYTELRERKKNLQLVHEMEEDERARRLRGLICAFYENKKRLLMQELALHPRKGLIFQKGKGQAKKPGKEEVPTEKPLVSPATIKAHVIIQEEKERERRISEENYLDEMNKEMRADNQALARIKEEEEKVRRVSNEEYLDELERERSATNRAFSRIEEEEERMRRIAETQYLEEKGGAQKKEPRKDRGWAKEVEEEERNKRLTQLGTGQIEMIKQMHTEMEKTRGKQEGQQPMLKPSLHAAPSKVGGEATKPRE